MSPIFDGLYLVSVDWAKKDVVNSFIPSQIPLEAIDEESSSEEFVYEIPMYHKIGKDFYQVAVKSTTGCPLESGQPMFQIPNTNFWIIKGEWRINQANKGYHHCPSINTGGELKISVNGTSIQVRIVPNIVDFDFEALKADFEGQLWDLLTLNSAKAKIKHLEHKVGTRIVHFANTDSIHAFIHEFEKIAKNPKCELKASSSDRPLDKVKPIPATFRKMAVTGTSRSLPSKGFVENVDIYENRYLCWMLDKIGQITRYNIDIIEYFINKLDVEIVKINAQKEELTKIPVINQEDALEELNTQRKKVLLSEEKWKKISSELNCTPGIKYHSTLITFIYKFDNRPNTFGCKTSNRNFCRITFPSQIARLFEEEKELWFELSAHSMGTKIDKNGLPYECFEVTSVKAIKSLKEQRILEKQKQNIAMLIRNNWKKNLNPSEINEGNQQVATLDRLLNKIEQQRIDCAALHNELGSINIHLKKLAISEFAKKVNFKRITHFQPSMTFVQNPQYRNAVKHYQESFNSLGINIEIFDSFEQITEYGVREMPQIYELWVLVSIIKILESTYGYQPNSADLERLVKEISPKNVKMDKGLIVSFTEGLVDRTVTLYYQKTLPNGKRPDFMLGIQTDRNKIFLVLDAKFKNYYCQKHILKDLKNTNEKYLGDKHYVFVVHPCIDPKFSNLGSKAIYFEKDIPTMPFHQYGYLSVQPGFTDSLKKVIGMAFEYLIEGSYDARQDDGTTLDPMPQGAALFCLNCGTSHTELKQIPRPKPPVRYHYTNTCENSACGHVAYFDYCWNCKTKLYKHGSYWDYHRTSVWSAFDIHCPKCGLTVADKFNA